MKKLIIMAAFLAASFALTGCEEQPQQSARARQQQATASITDEADRQIGMPAITKFSERKLMRDVLERRDRAAATFAYVQGLDGRLTCLGRAIGYGLPYGAQFTAPEYVERHSDTGGGNVPLAQPEPNGLYMPDNAAATWLQLVDPDTGKVDVIYIEPNIVVSPFRIHGPAVAADCPATPTAAS